MLISVVRAWKDHKKIKKISEAVNAMVVSSRVDKRTGKMTTKHGSRRVTFYQPVIEFAYEVDGRTYTCKDEPERPGIWTRWDTAEGAAKFLKQYPVGANFTAYYNPDKPAEALAIRSHPNSPYIGIGFIALMMLGFQLLKWRVKRRQHSLGNG